MESTLGLTMTELKAETGRGLGYGRDSSAWDSYQSEEIDRVTESGLRRFYFQAQVDPKDGIHTWSFLKPVAAVQLTTGDEFAALPDDFNGFEGRGTVSLTGSTAGGYWPVEERHEEQLRVLFAAAPTASGRPIYYAESQIRGTATQAANRQRVQVYPKPDQDYVLNVPYNLLPNALTTANPYPYGGAVHAETMKAAMLAAAELYLDNENGPQSANYRMCLAASIQMDRRHQPKTLGLNYDRSDAMMHRRSGHWAEGLWHPLGIGYLGTASYQ